MKFLQLENGLWKVQSGESIYYVDKQKQSCTCRAGYFGKECKHLKIVRGIK